MGLLEIILLFVLGIASAIVGSVTTLFLIDEGNHYRQLFASIPIALIGYVLWIWMFVKGIIYIIEKV